MTGITQGIFERLPPGARRAVEDFQRYVRSRAGAIEEWPEARHLIQDIATELTFNMTPAPPPVFLAGVSSRLSTRVRIKEARFSSQDGQLIPVKAGFVATVFGQPSFGSAASRGRALNRRGRFTLAHELGHIFFFRQEHPEAIPSRLLQGASDGRSIAREERLCDAFAGSLLMPESCKELLKPPYEPTQLFVLSDTFQVSAEATVHRVLYDWSLWVSSVFLRIRIERGVISVKRYLGGQRSHDSRVPSSHHLERSLSGLASLDAVETRLPALITATARMLGRRGGNLWVAV